MAYPISDVPRRIVYSGSAGVGPYAFTFEVLAATDIAVYKNSTLLTLTTDYTVSINTGTGTGTVTLVVAATGSDTVTIVGDRAIQRTSDFVTGGDLFANTLNDELDAQTIYAQQIDEKADRAIRSRVTDPTTLDMTLPAVASRANKLLGFTAGGAPTVSTRTIAEVDAAVGSFVSGTGNNAATVIYDPAGTNAVPTTVQAKLRETVSVKDFGAVGDGVTDDTAAIVNALATGKDVMLTDGTYRLAPTAVQTIANQGYQRLYGEGNVTLSVNLASSIDLFAFNGPVALENLTIDFNNSYAQHAFKWNANAGHVCIKNIRLRNLKDIASTTGSITFWIIPTGNTFEINGVKASSMLKRGNGNITDTNGSYNMIYVGGGAGSTQGSIKDVFASEVHNINALDQIIFEDTAVIYVITDSSDSQNRIEISNIQGYNFGKRLLKIHASNVAVSNVTGYSTTGDTLGVIGFLSGDGQGEKFGCSGSSIKVYGAMSSALSASAPSVRWSNIVCSVTGPATAPGVASNDASALVITSDGTCVDNFWSDSARDIAIGSSSGIVKNTVLRNVNLVINSGKEGATTIYNSSATMGFDGLLIDGLTATVSADALNIGNGAPIWLAEYLNGTTKKGQNLTIKNVTTTSNAQFSSYFIYLKYIENVSIESVKYNNTSGLSHFRLLLIENCVNVNVDDVIIEGTNQIGVFIKDCTGRSTIGRVYNPNASTAAVYNNNSTDVWVYGCDQTKVSGQTTATPQYTKYTVATTANRPTTGLVAGYSQHFDTTLGIPIWWNGSVWKDAAGTTV